MSQSISLWGATYSNVPAVNLPKSGGGTARFTDTSVTTAQQADVASGKIFIDSSGNQQTGTASGGGGDSKNAQAVTSTTRVTSTSLKACSGTITVAKTGTYDVYWSTHRTSTS